LTTNAETPAEFAEPPPSRRLGRPEEVNLTPAERAEQGRRRLLGHTQFVEPPRVWEPGAPSSPEVLRLLDYPHAANGQPLPPRRPQEPVPPGPHASDAELAAHAGRRHRTFYQYGLDEELFMDRFRYWVGLDVCQKSQLAADVQFGKEESPQWTVHVPADPAQPPLVLRAPDELTACRRYKALCGITAAGQLLGQESEPVVAVRFEPAPAA
jgi:hypothetical protein